MLPRLAHAPKLRYVASLLLWGAYLQVSAALVEQLQGEARSLTITGSEALWYPAVRYMIRQVMFVSLVLSDCRGYQC